MRITTHFARNSEMTTLENVGQETFRHQSAMPEARGTADTMAEPNPPPVNPPRTHSQLYHHPCLRSRTDGRRRT